MKRPVSTRSYGHGIGAGDVNGDKRNDILTPQGWLEAPAGSARAGQLDVSRHRLAAEIDPCANASRDTIDHHAAADGRSFGRAGR